MWFVVCGLWFVVCGFWFLVCGFCYGCHLKHRLRTTSTLRIGAPQKAREKPPKSNAGSCINRTTLLCYVSHPHTQFSPLSLLTPHYTQRLRLRHRQHPVHAHPPPPPQHLLVRCRRELPRCVQVGKGENRIPQTIGSTPQTINHGPKTTDNKPQTYNQK